MVTDGRAPREPTRTVEERRFRQLLAAVASGEHTSRGLTREEAAEVTDLLLGGRIPEAQIGAFLIAHRIRRPEVEELVGMLQSFRKRGPVLSTPGRRCLCFNVPYDGRTRTAPLLPLVALVLASTGLPVVLHGGDPMPVKYGVTLAELFEVLDIEWRGRNLAETQSRLERHGLALTHQPAHFPSAQGLVKIRDLIGKRPPVASLELLWTPHEGEHMLVSGFVHPPTEARAWEALERAGEAEVVTVKGLEGSTDLPTTRAGITARRRGGTTERLLLHPREHGIHEPEIPWTNPKGWKELARAALLGEGPMAPALAWNVAAWLWFAGRSHDMASALEQAQGLLRARSGERVRQELAG